MDLEGLRRKAEFCLRSAELAESHEAAVRLKALAGDYLLMVDMDGEQLMHEEVTEEDAVSPEEVRLDRD